MHRAPRCRRQSERWLVCSGDHLLQYVILAWVCTPHCTVRAANGYSPFQLGVPVYAAGLPAFWWRTTGRFWPTLVCRGGQGAKVGPRGRTGEGRVPCHLRVGHVNLLMDQLERNSHTFRRRFEDLLGIRSQVVGEHRRTGRATELSWYGLRTTTLLLPLISAPLPYPYDIFGPQDRHR